MNMPEDGVGSLVETIKGLKDQPLVIDHLVRVRGIGDLSLTRMIDLLQQGNVWLMISNGQRVSTWPARDEFIPVGKAFIEANPQRLVWGTDRPHPLHSEFMPSDADLLELFCRHTDGDQNLRRKILVDNPTALFFRDLPDRHPSMRHTLRVDSTRRRPRCSKASMSKDSLMATPSRPAAASATCS